MADLHKLDRAELIELLRTSEEALYADTREEKRLLHDLQAHRVELELQNRELYEAQMELEASRDRYADLYDFAPVGYLTLDDRARVIDANLKAAELLGLPRGRLLNSPLASRLANGQSGALFAHLRELFAAESVLPD